MISLNAFCGQIIRVGTSKSLQILNVAPLRNPVGRTLLRHANFGTVRALRSPFSGWVLCVASCGSPRNRTKQRRTASGQIGEPHNLDGNQVTQTIF